MSERIRCKLAEAGICTRQPMTHCGEVPVVDSSSVIDQRVVPVDRNNRAVETTSLDTLCNGKTITKKTVGPSYSNLSSGQII